MEWLRHSDKIPYCSCGLLQIKQLIEPQPIESPVGHHDCSDTNVPIQKKAFTESLPVVETVGNEASCQMNLPIKAQDAFRQQYWIKTTGKSTVVRIQLENYTISPSMYISVVNHGKLRHWHVHLLSHSKSEHWHAMRRAKTDFLTCGNSLQ